MPKLPITFFTFLFLVLTPTNIALAESGISRNSGSINTKTQIEKNRLEIKQNMQLREKEMKARLASKAAERKEKLKADKEKICENRKDNITSRAGKVESRVEKQFSRFGELVTKIDTFYTTKLVPKGVTVASYATLKSDIAVHKAEVQGLITTLKADIAAFDCAGNNPKGQIATIKADFRVVYSAMKDYRTSIIDFIQVIKQAVADKKTSTTSADKVLD